MDDFVLVNVLHALDELLDVVACFQFVQALPTAHQVTQRLILADIQHDIYVVLVLEVPIEAHNVLMVQGAVNLDLTRQLLSCLRASEVLLADDLECPRPCALLLRLDWVESPHLVGLGKAALLKD